MHSNSEKIASYTTRTTTHSCWTRKRSVHVYSPGVAAAAADVAVYSNFPD